MPRCLLRAAQPRPKEPTAPLRAAVAFGAGRVRRLVAGGRGRRSGCRQAPWDLVITSSPPESVHWIGWRLQRLRDRVACRFPRRLDAGAPSRGDPPADPRMARPPSGAGRDRHGELDHGKHPARGRRFFDPRMPAAKDRIHVLPTGFVEDHFEPVGRDNGKFRLVYTGRFSLSWRRGLAGAAVRWSPPCHRVRSEFAESCAWFLLGSFTDEERAFWQAPPLAAVVEELPTRPYADAMQLAAGATMLLLVAPRGLRSVIPRKLFDYLAAAADLRGLRRKRDHAHAPGDVGRHVVPSGRSRRDCPRAALFLRVPPLARREIGRVDAVHREPSLPGRAAVPSGCSGNVILNDLRKRIATGWHRKLRFRCRASDKRRWTAGAIAPGQRRSHAADHLTPLVPSAPR